MSRLITPTNGNELLDLIKEKRPNLSQKSITDYYQYLRKIYMLSFSNKPWYNPQHIDIEKYNNVTDVLKGLSNTKYNVRKTYLSAIYVLTSNEKYKEQMLKDIKTYDKEIDKQMATPQQKKNWVTSQQLQTTFNHYKELAEPLILKAEHDGKITNKEFSTIQKYLAASLYCGIYIPPRRVLDYSEFKLRNIDDSNDNYLSKSGLVFNRYKTGKYYNKQIVPIPKELRDTLLRVINISPFEWLFVNQNGDKLGENGLKQLLKTHLNTSVNALRHTYLTDRFSDYTKEYRKLQNMMTMMGSSSKQLVNYVKLNV